MSLNKETVTKYMESYTNNDDEGVSACLTDDVAWEMPGYFSFTGKAAFLKEKNNEMSTGNTQITVTRLVEENNVVVAEGRVRSEMRTGGWLEGVFCDVFEMKGGKVKKLISYFMKVEPV